MKVIPVSSLWQHFTAQGRKFLVLRDFEGLPDSVRSDLDIAVCGEPELPFAEQAIRKFAESQNIELITVVRRSYVWQFKLLDRSSPAQLVIDVHFQGEGWRGPLYLTISDLFETSTERLLWREPSLAYQAMMALFQHLLWGGFYKAKYHELLPRWIAGCEAEFAAAIARAFGSQWGIRVPKMVRERDVAALERSVQALRWNLWLRRGFPDFPGSLGRLVQFVWGEVKITAARQGRWVVLIGPDGVGKTSIAQGLFPEVAPFFRSLKYHHWIPSWTRPLSTKVPPGGGRFEPAPCRGGFSGDLLSTARLARSVCRAWLGYVLRILPALLRQRLVLGDRYLFNYHLDPQSVRYGASQRWVKWALRLVPKPDLIISLVANPETIHARKAELPVAEIELRIARARELEALGFNVLQVSAEAPLPNVIEQVAIATIRSLKS